jgi:hypothetical protein
MGKVAHDSAGPAIYRPHASRGILKEPDNANRGTVDAVNCTKCGGAGQQGPDGSWLCPLCGPISGTAPAPTVGCRP